MPSRKPIFKQKDSIRKKKKIKYEFCIADSLVFYSWAAFFTFASIVFNGKTEDNAPERIRKMRREHFVFAHTRNGA